MMSDEQRYRKALEMTFNVMNDGGDFAMFKPLSARATNDCINFIAAILDGLSIEQALEYIKNPTTASKDRADVGGAGE